jgi:hypothetical protein
MVQMPDRFLFPGVNSPSLRIAPLTACLQHFPELGVHRASPRPHRTACRKSIGLDRTASTWHGGDRARDRIFRLLGWIELQIQLKLRMRTSSSCFQKVAPRA